MTPPAWAGEKNLFLGVNRPSDPANMSDLERRHLPVITAPQRVHKDTPFDVTIEVGNLLAHPNDPGHFIQFLELWVDETFLARMDMTPGRACPKVTLRVALHYPAKELRARGGCNLHGVWIGQAPITVEA